MTMLDRMRRHKGWLKWSLALVVLTFVVFYIPDFLSTATGASPSETLADVEGSKITVQQFQRRYNAQVQAYRNAYGGQLNEQLLKQLGIDRQILQQLVDEEAMVAEAKKQGITVSDAEIRERILTMPGFQQNGAFVGEAAYRRVLQMQNPPMTTTDFEETLRRALSIEKLRNALTNWMSVADSDVDAEFKKRNEKVKLDVVPVTAEAFKSQVTIADADLAKYFEAHKDNYKIGEKRKIKYAVLNVEQVRNAIKVPETEITAWYQQNISQYQTPAQIRASHILFHTEGKDEAKVKAAAEEVLKKAKAPGADFAALAKQYSEDDSNKAQGGDLDYFGRGKMVPEFENAAFSMKVGEVSDLVKSQFGYHIIKLTDSKPESVRSLADAHAEIEDQLKWRDAQAEAEKQASAIEATIKTPADLDKAAKDRGLTVQETGFFATDEPVGALGPQPELAQSVFALADGTVTTKQRVAAGWVFATVTGKQAAHAPTLDEVKTKVKDDASREKAAELAKTKANEIAATLKTAKDFAAAAKKAGLEVKTTDLIARGAAIPDLGISDAIDKAAFALPKGGISDAITTPTGTAIIRVVDKAEVTPQQITDGRDELRDELINQRRDKFFGAYMTKAKTSLKININQATLAKAIGS